MIKRCALEVGAVPSSIGEQQQQQQQQAADRAELMSRAEQQGQSGTDAAADAAVEASTQAGVG
jgi:hypothetical protein